MIEIHVAYEGELRCSAIHVPSGARFGTDAPKDNMGRGESFSPTDLIAAALGTCIMTVMGITALRLGVDLAGTTIRVNKDMITAPVRRVGQLQVDIVVPRDITPEHRRRLESSAIHCPVHKSLHPDIDVSVAFRWDVEARSADV